MSTPGNRFVSFVRACAQSGGKVKVGLNSTLTPFPFPLCLGERPSLFPCAPALLPFSLETSEIKEDQ